MTLDAKGILRMQDMYRFDHNIHQYPVELVLVLLVMIDERRHSQSRTGQVAFDGESYWLHSW
jgi:hypothetical protein